MLIYALRYTARLAPGCFEKVYEEILYHELIKLGCKVQRQILLPIQYDELYISNAYKLDLIIEDMLVLESKSVYPLPPVYFKQYQNATISFKFKTWIYY